LRYSPIASFSWEVGGEEEEEEEEEEGEEEKPRLTQHSEIPAASAAIAKDGQVAQVAHRLWWEV